MYLFRLISFLGFLSVVNSSNSQSIQQARDLTVGSKSIEFDVHCVEASDGSMYCLTTSGTNTAQDNGLKTDTAYGGSDYWLYKLDENGSFLWDRTFGGDEIDRAKDIVIHGNHLFLLGDSESSVSGNKTSINKGDDDYWVVKTDLQGNKLWDVSIGADTLEYLSKGLITNDNQLLLCGHSLSSISGDKTEPLRGAVDAWLVKLNINNGTIQWNKTLGGTGYDRAKSISQGSSGNYYTACISDSPQGLGKTAQSYGASDFWLLKLDSNGNRIGDYSYGGSDFETEIRMTRNGKKTYLVGYSRSTFSGNKTVSIVGSGDYWLLQLDEDFEIDWQISLGGDQNGEDFNSEIIASGDNDIYVVGSSNALPGTGNIGSNPEYGDMDYVVFNLDTLGNIDWTFRTGGSVNDFASEAVLLDNNQLFIAGRSTSGASGMKSEPAYGQSVDNWLVWLDIPLFINERAGLSENKVSVFPNPSSDFVKFKLNNETNFRSWEIVSLSGKIIKTGKVKTGYNSINLTNISRGTYFLNLKTENGVLTKKLVKL